jgi:hypothetical protein
MKKLIFILLLLCAAFANAQITYYAYGKKTAYTNQWKSSISVPVVCSETVITISLHGNLSLTVNNAQSRIYAADRLDFILKSDSVRTVIFTGKLKGTTFTTTIGGTYTLQFIYDGTNFYQSTSVSGSTNHFIDTLFLDKGIKAMSNLDIVADSVKVHGILNVDTINVTGHILDTCDCLHYSAGNYYVATRDCFVFGSVYEDGIVSPHLFINTLDINMTLAFDDPTPSLSFQFNVPFEFTVRKGDTWALNTSGPAQICVRPFH